MINLRVQITDERGDQHRIELEMPAASVQELRLMAMVYGKPLAEVFAVACSAGLDVMLGEYSKMMLKHQRDDMNALMAQVMLGIQSPSLKSGR
jgi:hypothetical protein